VADLNIGFTDLAVVRGIQSAPAVSGNEHLNPRVRGARIFGGQIAADIARGNF
jgi:hypothetical protein